MRMSFILLVFIFTFDQSDAQSISMESISSGGELFSGPNSILTFTTGEIMSATYTGGNTTLIEGFQQQYFTYWVGVSSTAWTDLLNWSGGPVPGPRTDVIILTGAAFYPIINLNASCRSLFARPGTTLTVSPSFSLTIQN